MKGNTVRLLTLLLAAIAAVASGFVVHVITAKWLPHWMAVQIGDGTLTPSWNVRYIAGLTSIEYGVGGIMPYLPVREKLVPYGWAVAIFVVFALLASLHGALPRQPLMDFVIDNPIQVVLVQNLLKLCVWLLMSIVIVLGMEAIAARNRPETGARR